MAIRTLLDLSLAAACQHLPYEALTLLPHDSKQRMIEYITSHDQISSKRCISLFSNPFFGCNLTQVHFYLSNKLTDEILEALMSCGPTLERVAIIECPAVTDKGINSVTVNQRKLHTLELRNLRGLTSNSLKFVYSPLLHSVDLSGCSSISSEGIFYLVFNNSSIGNLCLNNCNGIDDQALSDIGYFCRENLRSLELDFLHRSRIIQRAEAIHTLSQLCPNISQLSLCRFFNPENEEYEKDEEIGQEMMPIETFRIEGTRLRHVDLYGNYFSTLPSLPPTVHSIRLSVTGQENISDFRLESQRQLLNVHLQLLCTEEDARSIENANRFLCDFIPLFSCKITRLSVTAERLDDSALMLITQLPNLSHLALDVPHLNAFHLWKLFAGGLRCRGGRLSSLRLSRSRLTYRAIFAIGRCAKSLTELELSHMKCVDDRLLALLSENCRRLSTVNFNGCKFVTDKGLSKLAKNCRLREVRIRGTACTDLSLGAIARYCPNIEWISHADYSGRPRFSEGALQHVRDACIQRVIC